MITNKIRYLKSCYQADLRAVSLLNFYGKKAAHQLMLESFEPISGELKEFPISTEWSKKLEAHMAIHGKEKALYCGAIFLTGKTNIAGKKEKVFAPLYLYPTDLLIEDEIYYIAIDAQDPIINPAIANILGDGKNGVFEALYESLPKGYLNFDAVDIIEKTLFECFPEIDISYLANLPQLIPNIEREKLLKKIWNDGQMAFLNLAGLCSLKKPIGSRGILNELEELELLDKFSNPINILFGNNSNTQVGKPYKTLHIPAVLSDTQTAIVSEAQKFPLRLVVGPPGTGKSFTIAALAIEMQARGKSVLIASKNVEAVEVVADKIERDLGLEEIVVRASRIDFRKAVQVRLKNLSFGFEFKHIEYSDLNKSKYEIERINDKIRKIEKNIIYLQKKNAIVGDFLYEYTGGFFQKVKYKWLQYKHQNKKEIWELTSELEKLITNRNARLKKYIKQKFYFYLKQAFNYSRYDIQALNQALRARTGNRKADLFEETDFDTILKVLPIWTVSISDVHKIFPLYRELFDVVIIDEATQCDMASPLPLLQRAKSVLVVGDPKQLRHLSFLSRKQQNIFASQFDISFSEAERLDYREKSLLDLVEEKLMSQHNVYFLNEHYRSMPDIISFSNKRFYAGKLNIMTDTLEVRNKKHNFIIKIDGKRSAKGYNEKEADSVFNEMIELMRSEASLEKQVCQSIGIVSPFRDQIDFLQKKANKELSPDLIERHRVMIGTPFSFQGEERDVIYLSTGQKFDFYK